MCRMRRGCGYSPIAIHSLPPVDLPRHPKTHTLISLFLPFLVVVVAWRTQRGHGVEALFLLVVVAWRTRRGHGVEALVVLVAVTWRTRQGDGVEALGMHMVAA